MDIIWVIQKINRKPSLDYPSHESFLDPWVYVPVDGVSFGYKYFSIVSSILVLSLVAKDSNNFPSL
jgi:hypothetical protein